MCSETMEEGHRSRASPLQMRVRYPPSATLRATLWIVPSIYYLCADREVSCRFPPPSLALCRQRDTRLCQPLAHNFHLPLDGDLGDLELLGNIRDSHVARAVVGAEHLPLPLGKAEAARSLSVKLVPEIGQPARLECMTLACLLIFVAYERHPAVFLIDLGQPLLAQKIHWRGRSVGWVKLLTLIIG